MLPASEGCYVYTSTGSDAECVPESNVHVTITLEVFATSPISNVVYHVLRTSPCISRDSGDDGTNQTVLRLLVSTAAQHVTRSMMVTSSVASRLNFVVQIVGPDG